jgi:hypothetical protein
LRVERDPGHTSGDVEGAIADKLDKLINTLNA